jgi:hypothetical protein
MRAYRRDVTGWMALASGVLSGLAIANFRFAARELSEYYDSNHSHVAVARGRVLELRCADSWSKRFNNNYGSALLPVGIAAHIDDPLCTF